MISHSKIYNVTYRTIRGKSYYFPLENAGRRFSMENRVWRRCAAIKLGAPLPRGPAVGPSFFLLNSFL